jgi:CRISPR/Cas system endoribonuclease Cas6 (RAMP superfamily)
VVAVLVTAVNVFVLPLRTSIGPPVSSKVLKYCFEGSLKRKVFGSYANTSISMLFDGGRPLYSKGDEPVVLEAGRRYSGRVVVVDEEPWLVDAVSSALGPEFKCSGTYGDLIISIPEVEVVPMEGLRLDLPEVFKLVFQTPTVLTSKLMTPPTLADKVRPMHKLIPQPSFIFSHLLRMWNSFAPPELKIGKPSEWAPYLLGRQADLTLIELDYRVRPETVVVGRDNSGRLRKVRGFRGWVLYRSTAPRKLLEVYSKLLALAQLTGIGRSRGIGLGQLAVRPGPEQAREAAMPQQAV